VLRTGPLEVIGDGGVERGVAWQPLGEHGRRPLVQGGPPRRFEPVEHDVTHHVVAEGEGVVVDPDDDGCAHGGLEVGRHLIGREPAHGRDNVGGERLAGHRGGPEHGDHLLAQPRQPPLHDRRHGGRYGCWCDVEPTRAAHELAELPHEQRVPAAALDHGIDRRGRHAAPHGGSQQLARRVRRQSGDGDRRARPGQLGHVLAVELLAAERGEEHAAHITRGGGDEQQDPDRCRIAHWRSSITTSSRSREAIRRITSATAAACPNWAAADSPGDSALKSARAWSDPTSCLRMSAHGHNGGAPSPCQAVVHAVRAPSARARPSVSSARRVLPMPGSPLSSTSAPRDSSRPANCEPISSSWTSRPTSP
jgi:hypothetical protein